MLPSAGQGAINAMQDATILANCINDIKRLDRESISAHLKDYQDQRYQFAKIQFETSKRFAVIMGGQVRYHCPKMTKKVRCFFMLIPSPQHNTQQTDLYDSFLFVFL